MATRATQTLSGGSASAHPDPQGAQRLSSAPAWSLMMLNVAVLTSVLQQVEPQLAAISLDHKTLFMLSLVEDYDQPSTLAGALCTPRPTVTALIKRAESNGYLRRGTVPGDLRRFRLTLTASGRRALTAGRRIVEVAFAARLARVSDSDRIAFERAVRAMATNAM